MYISPDTSGGVKCVLMTEREAESLWTRTIQESILPFHNCPLEPQRSKRGRRMESEDPGWRELDILEAIYLNRLDLLKDEHRRNFLSQYENEITGQQRQGISSTSSASTAMSSSGPGSTKVCRKRSLLQMIDEIIDGADLATQRAEALLKELRKLKEELIVRPSPA